MYTFNLYPYLKHNHVDHEKLFLCGHNIAVILITVFFFLCGQYHSIFSFLATCDKTSGLAGLFGSITVVTIIAILLCFSNVLICNWLLFRVRIVFHI